MAVEWEDRAAQAEDMIAIGGDKEKHKQEFSGVYQHSEARTGKRNKTQLVHMFNGVDKENPAKLYGVWGFHTLDKALLTIPVGTPCRIKYKGSEEIGDGQTLKIVSVDVPKGTPRIARKAPRLAVQDAAPEGEEVPF
jgi:hypothetical protein